MAAIDESHRNLELINFCRPHIRNHAIAITMAGKAETGSKDKGENYGAPGNNVSRIASVSRQNMQQLVCISIFSSSSIMF